MAVINALRQPIGAELRSSGNAPVRGFDMCGGDGVASKLHLKMRLATSRESLLLKYQQNRNGVQFVKRFSVGGQRDSRFTLALTEN